MSKRKLRVSKSIIFYIVRLLCRYFIALMMFSYASAKILGTQFSSDLSIGERTIDSMNGFELTWYFFGYSPTYGIFIAVSQIVAALLILFRKTVRIGVVLLLSFMVNIVMLDIFYEIEAATPMAILLTSMGFFLLFSDWKAFKAYFLKAEVNMHSYSEQLPLKLRKIHWVKYILIPLMFSAMFFSIYQLRDVYMHKNDFYGVWVVKGQPINKIDKVYFELRDRIVLRDTAGNLYNGTFRNTGKSRDSFQINTSHYSNSMRNFVKRKLDTVKIVGEENIKKEQTRLIELYNKNSNTDPIYISGTYKLVADTLYLIQDNNMEMKLVKEN